MDAKTRTFGGWTAAAMLALTILGGCEAAPPLEGDAAISGLKQEVQTLRQANIDLKQQLFEANHRVGIEQDAKAALTREVDKLRVDLAKANIASAHAAAKEAGKTETVPAAPTPGVTVASQGPVEGQELPKAADTEDPQALIKRLTTEKADLEHRAVELQASIATGQAKAATLARSSVDQKQEVPTGGKLEGGTVYRAVPCPHPYTSRNGSYVVARCGCLDPARSHYAAMGPAIVKGDFRSALDKTTAVNEAKAVLTPLHVELRKINDQLAKIKDELAKARATP